MKTARYVLTFVSLCTIGPNLVFAYAFRTRANLIAGLAAAGILAACLAWNLVAARRSS